MDVAGKAEELLNRVDKTAAVALQQQKDDKESQYYDGLTTQMSNNELNENILGSSTPIDSLNKIESTTPDFIRPEPSYKLSSPMSVSKTSKPVGPSRANSVISKPKDEESLFEYLNASDVAKTLSKSTTDTKTQSAEVICIKDTNEPGATELQANSKNLENATPIESSTKLTASDKSVISPEATCAIEKESKLRQVETLPAAKESSRPSSLLAAEVRELKAREVDYSAALEAKDSQLAILRVRLQEADLELQSARVTLTKDTKDNERLKEELSIMSEINNDIINKLKLKLSETELALQDEKHVCGKATVEARLNFSKLEEEKQHHAENLASNQKNLSELKSQVKDLSQQLRQSKSALETVKQDLAYYRQKAQRLLQSKEKLISTLKDNNLNNEEQEGSEGIAKNLEESLTKENDSLREDLIQSMASLETLRSEMQNLELNYQEEMERGHEKSRNLEESLQTEKQCREDLENEIQQYKEELKFLREDLTRTKTNLHSRIKDRDLEVEKLRKQLTTKMTCGSNQSELESRIRQLTESLIQKQTVLEALSTEKNSMVMQLERMEQRLQETQLSMNKGQSTLSVGIPFDDSKHRFHGTYFSENPFDGKVTKNVKKAYGIIDSLSIRTGSFLRRNPASRAFLLAYMFLLHIWVLIILLSYQPEIHGKGHEIPL